MNVSLLNTTGWPHKDQKRLGPGEPTALLWPLQGVGQLQHSSYGIMFSGRALCRQKQKQTNLESEWGWEGVLSGLPYLCLWKVTHSYLIIASQVENPKRSRTKIVRCRAATNIILTSWACAHGPAVTHPSLTPEPQNWTCSEPRVVLQFSEFSWNFQSPFTPRPWSTLAAVTPATAGLTQRALLGPRGRVSIAVTLLLLNANREGHALGKSMGHLREVSTVAPEQEGPCCKSWPEVCKFYFCLFTFSATHRPRAWKWIWLNDMCALMMNRWPVQGVFLPFTLKYLSSSAPHDPWWAIKQI